MKTKLFLMAIFSLPAIFAYSQKGPDFEKWDANDDNIIDKSEYSTNSQIYNNWDDNKDNRLSQSEFQKAFFKLFNSNNDDVIDANEWAEAKQLVNANKGFLGFTKEVNLDDWDADKNSSINKVEFNAGVIDLFNAWDDDNNNTVSKDEFFNKSFNWWDLNNDGDVTKDEFNQIKDLTKNNQTFWEKLF